MKEEPFELRKFLHEADWLGQMGELPEKKELSYLLVLAFQLFFIYFNCHFASTGSRGHCLDRPHGLDFLVLRPWLLGSALADLLTTLLGLTVVLLFLGGALGEEKFLGLERVVGGVWLGKLVLWAAAQAVFLAQTMSDGSCPGSLLNYLRASVVVQTITAVGVLVRRCSQNEQ